MFGKNVAKGATAFKAAGGFAGLNAGMKDAKASKIARKETKDRFEHLKKTNMISQDMSFKDFMNTDEGKQLYDRRKTKAKEMKSRTEKRNEVRREKKIENAVKKKVEEKYGEGSYDEFKNAVKENREARYKDGGNERTISKENVEKELEETRKEVFYDSNKKDGDKSYSDKKSEIETEKTTNQNEENTFNNTIEDNRTKINNGTLTPQEKNSVENQTYKSADGKANLSYAEIKQQIDADKAANGGSLSSKGKKLQAQIDKACYDAQNGEGSYERKKSEISKKKEETKEKEKEFKEQTSTPGKGLKTLHDNITITGAKISNGIENFTNPTSPMGKYYKAALDDSARVVSAIALGGMAYGATGNMQSAISAGQFGYGIVDGVLENSSNTVIKDGVEKMEKILKATGEQSSKIDELTEKIDELDKLGMLDMKDIKKDFKDVIGGLMSDNLKEPLLREITARLSKEGFDPRDDTELMNLIKNRTGDISDSDEKKIEQGLQKFIQDTLMAQYAQILKSAKSVGMQAPILGQRVQTKVIRNEKIINNIENNTYNYNNANPNL